MSQKINAKNLTYSQNLPPFLAALHSQLGGQTGPDPILAARRRPTKKRSASEEAEDAPLVLDEHGDVVAGVTVGADGAATVTSRDSGGGGDGGAEASNGNDMEKPKDKQESSTAGVGAGKKRKMGKVIGTGGENTDDEDEDDKDNKNGKTTRGETARGTTEKIEKRSGEAKTAAEDSGSLCKDGAQTNDQGKKKKKGKKIKLSFED